MTHGRIVLILALLWLGLELPHTEIRTLIDRMAGRPEQKLIFCLRRRTEAPNVRTVTYEYSDVYWADVEASGLRVYPPHGGALSNRLPGHIHAVGWLCDGAGLPADVRSRFPAARRVAGNPLYSFWTAEPPPGEISEPYTGP